MTCTLRCNAAVTHAINSWLARYASSVNRALRDDAIARILRWWVDPMNLEVGMLYAASHLASCARGTHSLEWLPGQGVGWTFHAPNTSSESSSATADANYAYIRLRRLLEFVTELYKEGGRSLYQPISEKSLLSPPRFLQLLRAHVVRWHMQERVAA